MSIIYVLIPIAILFVIIAIGIFFWAVKSEQFSDLNKQGHSILFDDDKAQTGDKSVKPSNDKSNNDN
ncbi:MULTISPECIES: cbb3-type cytochrome oxidase assembly protein CcoS [Pseudoalteromonas]|uniref:cbb3-type cytochrome oxidase assembly protein CcoS n=1 Tax=Pseudoalteromonas TaxID=53246 RepID=UPI000C7A3D1D|nr:MULTISPECIES: cbb3-type cytochrome oxidase assembly protein CcoS [Pseudoalteromonas]AUJ70302.1 Cytochrome oxidase maturation protein cbb3-type [Pseudoalteromonas sp. NC201]MBR8841365.1 cbb3-type cytochrome oxidase assembly protein CcoS [Pseudoalteromonas sp. JC3]MCF2826983.1 cbb3-type cytochrome oxidase assembly protein CcoS [Pseudoalteromonas sp. OF5H-5]MCF2832431.1 cbb3-type cytochrome oxidase assembly protein CcoS [Pseudoalteromonas sp. DL2-H6]MCF2923889.1 cbb3-type cytochrome oxidase as